MGKAQPLTKSELFAAGRGNAYALTHPFPDQRQQGEQSVIQRSAGAQVRRCRWESGWSPLASEQLVEDVAGHDADRHERRDEHDEIGQLHRCRIVR